MTLTKIVINALAREPRRYRVTTSNATITFPINLMRTLHLRPIPKEMFQHHIGPIAELVGTKAAAAYN